MSGGFSFDTGAGGGVIEERAWIQLAVIPTTVLGDTEFISFRLFIPNGNTLKIWSVGVQNDSNNTPVGLTAEVDDETNTINLVSENSKRTTGDPLAEVDGPVDVAMRAENNTGNDQNTSATFSYTIE